MANKFYQPGEARAGKVQDLFATVAPRYDLINDLQSFALHRWWKRKLIRLAAPRAGERALDVCCGTGDVSFGFAAKGVQTIGLDFSQAMLSVAQTRSRSGPSNGAHLSFVQGDAQNLPYPDNSFDIVTVSYGLRNLTDWKAGLREMYRVAM